VAKSIAQDKGSSKAEKAELSFFKFSGRAGENLDYSVAGLEEIHIEWLLRAPEATFDELMRTVWNEVCPTDCSQMIKQRAAVFLCSFIAASLQIFKCHSQRMCFECVAPACVAAVLALAST